MKNLIKYLSLAFIMVSLSFAQEQVENNFLFNTEKIHLSTFFFEVSPMTHFTSLNKQSANVFVMSAGFILNKKFSVSFFSAASPKINLILIPDIGTEEYDNWVAAGVKLNRVSASTDFLYVDFKHSGLKFGYLHNTEKIVFWRANLSVGFIGGLSMSENKSFMGLFNNEVYKESVFTAEPEFGVGINLLSWWRVYADVGYRFLSADTRVMSAADADSYTVSLTFGFGKFNN